MAGGFAVGADSFIDIGAANHAYRLNSISLDPYFAAGPALCVGTG
jgi:hypothetical protein